MNFRIPCVNAATVVLISMVGGFDNGESQAQVKHGDDACGLPFNDLEWQFPHPQLNAVWKFKT